MFKKILGIILVLSLLGCTGMPLYQTTVDGEPCTATHLEVSQQCPHASIQKVVDEANPTEVEYVLGFVEFDDQGQMFDRRQMNHFLNLIGKKAQEKNVLLLRDPNFDWWSI